MQRAPSAMGSGTTWGEAVSAAYLRCDAAKPSKVPPTAGVHTRGPGDGLIVEDGEGELAVRDEDYLESVYLQDGGEKAVSEHSQRAGQKRTDSNTVRQ